MVVVLPFTPHFGGTRRHARVLLIAALATGSEMVVGASVCITFLDRCIHLGIHLWELFPASGKLFPALQRYTKCNTVCNTHLLV